MSPRVALLVVALSGFIALSYEILWYRAFGLLLSNAPEAFGLLLGAYLFGLAFGSLASMRLTSDESTGDPRKLRAIAALVFVAGAVSFVSIPAFAQLAPYARWIPQVTIVATAAGALGAIFPLVSHACIAPREQVGVRLSQLYLANIIGSSLGSLLTGLWLLDIASLRTICAGLFLGSLLLTTALYTASKPPRGQRSAVYAGVVVLGVSSVLLTPVLFDRVYERLCYRDELTPTTRYAEIVENRSGIITVTADGVVWGGGAYEGELNTRPAANRNLIERAYAVGAVQPHPHRVLLIGLASGSWAQVLAHMPGVESLTVVEINPGYLEVIRRHAEVAGILTNPTVEIHIDDARRWLLKNVERRFDVIVQNTPLHWRNNTTTLLSREFLELCKQRLTPGGVYYYNTTWSDEAEQTGVTVFPYTVMFDSFIAASDTPVTFDVKRWESLVTNFQIEGKRVLDPEIERDRPELARLIRLGSFAPAGVVQTREQIEASSHGAEVVTDDNMATEWVHRWETTVEPKKGGTRSRLYGGRFKWFD